jgi:outer membrane lipoprotein-sorting protein
MDTNMHDPSPHEGGASRVVRAAIDELRQQEPEQIVVARAIERALAIPFHDDAPAADRHPRSRPWSRLTSWTRGLTMRRRIALGGAGVAVVLGFLLALSTIVARPVSAMERMAEELRKVKSYTATGIFEIETSQSRDSGKPASPPVGKGTNYWLAPGSCREDNDFKRKGWKVWMDELLNEVYAYVEGRRNEPGPGMTFIAPYPCTRPSIVIDHRSKSFMLYAPSEDTYGASSRLQDLVKFSGKADRDLGTKEIEGKQAHGFEIDAKKAFPNEYLQAGHTTWEIWIDTASNLPVLLRTRMKLRENRIFIHDLSDFQWNVDLDPKLFDPAPPAGYADHTPKPPTSQEQIRPAIESLKTYAEASGGHYPPEKRICLSTTGSDLCKLLGVEARWLDKWPKKGDAGNAGKAARAFEGFQTINDIEFYNHDAAYYGKTVGPKDKNKVLLRWKLDDGRYEVIFGDLRFQTVTSERLHALEGK